MSSEIKNEDGTAGLASSDAKDKHSKYLEKLTLPDYIREIIEIQSKIFENYFTGWDGV